MSLHYFSTRTPSDIRQFADVLQQGLAPDGGLYIPSSCETIPRETFSNLQGADYIKTAHQITYPFMKDFVDPDTTQELINKAYSNFHHPAIAPLIQIDTNHFICELFHGPTLAFKDFALQLLGQLYDHAFTQSNQRGIVIGATSGDTGSAAIEACAQTKNLAIVMLHPQGRISEIQRKQMTTVEADNVLNIAIEGTFDDCQRIVKESFHPDHQATLFGNSGTRFLAVNSINWARIMGQIVYYVYTALALGAPDRPVRFSVPSGNFGNVYAGYLAKQIGLPIDQLIVGTNENDILARFIDDCDYTIRQVVPTLAPSMDITIASNFERLLYHIRDPQDPPIDAAMQTLKETGHLPISSKAHRTVQQLFAAKRVDNTAICATIKRIYERCGYVADPHTAIAIEAAELYQNTHDSPIITLATAHPAKFPQAAQEAGIPEQEIPSFMASILEKPEHYDVLPASTDAVTNAIKDRLL